MPVGKVFKVWKIYENFTGPTKIEFCLSMTPKNQVVVFLRVLYSPDLPLHCFVAEAGLELHSFWLHLLSAEITSMHHVTQFYVVLGVRLRTL